VGCGGPTGLPVQEAYEAVTAALRDAALKSGGSAVIHIGYDYRITAAKNGYIGSEPVFEVYGWATAVKLEA
jgi:uncharacterized protein YbjQ (UPF0145 family)